MRPVLAVGPGQAEGQPRNLDDAKSSSSSRGPANGGPGARRDGRSSGGRLPDRRRSTAYGRAERRVAVGVDVARGFVLGFALESASLSSIDPPANVGGHSRHEVDTIKAIGLRLARRRRPVGAPDRRVPYARSAPPGCRPRRLPNRRADTA